MTRCIRRRQLITLLGGAAVAWPLAARAQQPKLPVVGFLPSASHYVTALRQGLKEAGFVEGQNVSIELHSAADQPRLPLLVADLLRRQVALIVGNTPSALAAKTATATVPIVFVTGGDPVRDGLVANLNRPGGNVTGVSFISHELAAKQLGAAETKRLRRLAIEISHFRRATRCACKKCLARPRRTRQSFPAAHKSSRSG
jgi:putative tryptophan/tyrosine transport system substrate-binding protein